MHVTFFKINIADSLHILWVSVENYIAHIIAVLIRNCNLNVYFMYYHSLQHLESPIIRLEVFSFSKCTISSVVVLLVCEYEWLSYRPCMQMAQDQIQGGDAENVSSNHRLASPYQGVWLVQAKTWGGQALSATMSNCLIWSPKGDDLHKVVWVPCLG